jgi:hypothetical protein
MRRMLVLASVLTVALLLPGRVLASDDCVCGVPSAASPFGGWEALLESTDPQLLMDRMVDPGELETSDPYAVRGVAPSSDDRVPQVLWCAHADDPRCSPLHPEDDPRPRLSAGGPSFLVPCPAAADRASETTPILDADEPLARTSRDTGELHASRLDRPPRA